MMFERLNMHNPSNARNAKMPAKTPLPGPAHGSVLLERFDVQIADAIKLGEKAARENLKINESFSNISEDQSSKRYFDE